MVAINLVALLLYGLCNWWLIRRSTGERMLLGYLLLLQSWSVASCFYNDCGVYNFELFQYTDPSFATTRLVFLYLCFNGAALALSRWLKDRPLVLTQYRTSFARLQPMLRTIALLVSVLFLGYVAFEFALSGIPILEGLHKLSYAEESGPLERLFLTHGFILLFLLGWVRKESKRDLTDLILVALLCYLIGAGHKFSQLIYLTVCYLIVPMGRLALQPKLFAQLGMKLRVVIPVALSVLLGLSFGSYLYGTEDNEFAKAVLLDRVLGNQGHLWWGTDQAYWTSGRFDSNHFQVEIDGAVSAVKGDAPPAGTVGMGYLMLNLLGPQKAYPIFDAGYLYTMAYPAIAVMSIGYGLTVVLQILWGALFMCLSVYLLRAVQERLLIRSGLALLILVPFITASFSGSLATVFTLGMALKFIFLLSIELGLQFPVLRILSAQKVTL